MPTTDETPKVPKQAAYRLACYAIIDLIPDAGLLELLDSMKDVYEWHVGREQNPPTPNLHLQAAVLRGNVVESYTRPVFPIAEE
jgi:hypothetical protein